MIRTLGDRKLLRLVAAHGKVTPCFFYSISHYEDACGFDSHSYATMLQQAIQKRDPNSAKSLHCHILKRGVSLDLFAQNVLLNSYVQFHSFHDASKLFDQMPLTNTVSFVTLAQGFSHNNLFHHALHLLLRLFREGREVNQFVFTSLLKLMVSMDLANMCWSVHAYVYKVGHHSDAYVGTALIDAYSVCGNVDAACLVFEGICCKDMVSWTGMIACYAENCCHEDSLLLFCRMRIVGFRPNNFTISAALKSCLGLEAFEIGKSVHGCALKACYDCDLYVGTALLELYAKSGEIVDARRFFEEMPKDDLIPWSLLIARYAQSDKSKEALELFCRMRKTSVVVPNNFTFASVLQACASLVFLNLGKQIHSYVLKVGLCSNVFVSNAVMDVYAKCGEIENSVRLFMESAEKNDVTWNTIIVGYVQLGDGEKAMSLFSNMLGYDIQPTEVTYSSVLRACASLAALEPGRQIHSSAIKTMYNKDIVVANSLVDMYAKCGRIDDARLTFDKMDKRDEVSWNAIICGYSMHGLGTEALNLFDMMQQTCKPNKLTFVGVLSACSNAGLLDKAQAYFKSMLQDYGIEPCIEHYTCMVWLFGRLGRFDEALRLIGELSFQPSVMVWRALLGACVIHKNLDLGRVCAKHVLEMEPHDDATHVLLSNMYATARRWDNVATVRKDMLKKRVKKEPGLSWVENQGVVHYFTVGDTSHPDTKLISAMLEWLNKKTRDAGYIPDCNVVLLDVEDDEKERLLWGHSERLALAFGLIKIPHPCSIRIIKNLRICVDCHTVIKLISKIVQREIVIRDINRFHHFRHGICSCGDYW